MKQYLEIGKINNTHGLRGEVKMLMWCDGIDYIKQLKKLKNANIDFNVDIEGKMIQERCFLIFIMHFPNLLYEHQHLHQMDLYG